MTAWACASDRKRKYERFRFNSIRSEDVALAGGAEHARLEGGLGAEAGPEQARALRVGDQRAGMKRIDEQRVRVDLVVAVRQAADEEVPREIHAFDERVPPSARRR